MQGFEREKIVFLVYLKLLTHKNVDSYIIFIVEVSWKNLYRVFNKFDTFPTWFPVSINYTGGPILFNFQCKCTLERKQKQCFLEENSTTIPLPQDAVHAALENWIRCGSGAPQDMVRCLLECWEFSPMCLFSTMKASFWKHMALRRLWTPRQERKRPFISTNSLGN